MFTTKPWRSLAILLAAALLLGTGCDDNTSDENGSTSDGSSMDGGSDAMTSLDMTTTGPDGTAGTCGATIDPGGDEDGDGIPNLAEDKNGNCEVDEGETSATIGDTDMDGIPDGDEDFNGDGQIDLDRGETDPLNPDSDGDGILDGDETTAVVCGRDLANAKFGKAAPSAKTIMALPADYTVSDHVALSADTFGNGDVFGFVWADTGVGELLQADTENLFGSFQESGYRGTIVLGSPPDTIPSPSWSDADPTEKNPDRFKPELFPLGPAFAVKRTQLSFADASPSEVRDGLLGALGSDASFDSGVSSDTCEKLSANWIAMLRNDATLVTAFVIGCTDTIEASEAAQAVMSDVIGGTVLAPSVYRAQDYRCESLVPQLEAGVVDFIWVIDNSKSMADEQENVAATAEKFMNTLQASKVDWRLGVTTTESYFLDGRDAALKDKVIAHDELIDATTGLRGRGFLEGADADAREEFEKYVTKDPNCPATDVNNNQIGPPGSNICGDGREDGLESGLYVLTNAQADERERFAMREDAIKIVVYVTDEENQGIKNQSEILPETDQKYLAYVEAMTTAYEGSGVIAYSIVGDVGVANGGICDPLVGNGIQGAQHGKTYEGISTLTGGGSGSVCNEDLQPTINAIIDEVIGVAASYKLEGYPIAHSIRVAVEGVELERGAAGWDYNASNNSIVISPTITISETSDIAIAYNVWKKTEG